MLPVFFEGVFGVLSDLLVGIESRQWPLSWLCRAAENEVSLITYSGTQLGMTFGFSFLLLLVTWAI